MSPGSHARETCRSARHPPCGGRRAQARVAPVARAGSPAEDQALLPEGIIALLREQGIDVVAQAEDGPGLLRIVAGHKPDLAIVDVRLPPTFVDEGVRAADYSHGRIARIVVPR